MLMAFSVRNYRSFRDRVTLRMAAPECGAIDACGAAPDRQDVPHAWHPLTCAVITGAGASGKRALVHAITVMRWMALHSCALPPDHPIAVEPFRLSTATDRLPSEFELIVQIDGATYRYGFAADRHAVVREWLVRSGDPHETLLATRDRQTITVHARTFREGHALIARTQPTMLFLSVAAQFNHPMASQLVAWLAALEVLPETTDANAALNRFAAASASERMLTVNLLRQLDLGIERLEVVRAGTPAMRGVAWHPCVDDAGHPARAVAFDVARAESPGTHRVLALTTAMVHALATGGVLVIDGFDARIHPLLAAELLGWFTDPAINRRRAQLIVTSRMASWVSALRSGAVQVWRLERSLHGASNLVACNG